MARFCTLGSSSGGNSTYIGTASYGILVDAGISCRRLNTAMKNADISPDSVKAVFITHEHCDHVSGLRVFAAQKKIPVYATGGTLAGLNNSGVLDGSFKYEKIMPDGISVGDMHITYFRTSHDAKESCGYRIELPDRTIGVATDTGIITGEILRGLCGCDLVLLESNYDENMLDFGPYPPYLKARIRSDMGHLSNPVCADTALQLLQMNIHRFVLGHLSRENNTPQSAYACTQTLLREAGAEQGRDYMLTVAPVEAMQQMIVF